MFDSLEARAAMVFGPQCRREWGESIVLREWADGGTTTTTREKLLVLTPGGGIALERHLGYLEVWIPSGPLDYVLEDAAGVLRHRVTEPYEAVVVPRGRRHRIHNAGHSTLYVRELQIGVVTAHDKEVFDDHRITDPGA